jgi:prephenate dehydrogenase
MSDVIITFVGAGVIGTSMGLALKRIDDPPVLIVHDKDPQNTRQAMKMGAFDKSEWNLINACEKADLIILAIPGKDIKSTLEAIAPYLKQDAIVSDTTESKHALVEMAATILPAHVHFVGGNPIVTAQPGPEHARADLFEKSLYCLTPSAKVMPEAVQLLEDFVNLISATPFYLDPLEHDGLMAGVNTLPTILRVALINSLTQANAWVEMRKLAGGVFAQVAAGANGDPDSMAERILANKTVMLHWLKSAIGALESIKDQIQQEDREALAQSIDQAVVERINWQKDYDSKALSNLYEAPTQNVEEPGMFKRMFGMGMGRRSGKSKDSDRNR